MSLHDPMLLKNWDVSDKHIHINHKMQTCFFASEHISTHTHTVNARTQWKGPDLSNTHFDGILDPYDDVTESRDALQFCMALANS